jgi:hypothetical protein
MRRVPYGSEQHLQDAWPGPCRDCGALDGQTHMFMCCLEECRRCQGQWPGCGHIGLAKLLDPWWWVLERLQLVR